MNLLNCEGTPNTNQTAYMGYYLQLVVRLVRMEELWMQEPVCVTVWMASVDLVVKVSALFGSTD